jgi:hypothetical protein
VNPKPISIERLAYIVKEATDALPADLLLRLLGFAVMPYSVTVRFNEELEGLHWFWSIARNGVKLLVYDDVEQYFSTGCLDDDGILRKWQNFGAEDHLDDAIRDLVGIT